MRKLFYKLNNLCQKTMFFAFAVLAASVVFTSCGGDDDDDDNGNGNGKKEEEEQRPVEPSKYDNVNVKYLFDEDNDYYELIEFTEDGLCIIVPSGYSLYAEDEDFDMDAKFRGFGKKTTKAHLSMLSARKHKTTRGDDDLQPLVCKYTRSAENTYNIVDDKNSSLGVVTVTEGNNGIKVKMTPKIGDETTLNATKYGPYTDNGTNKLAGAWKQDSLLFQIYTADGKECVFDKTYLYGTETEVIRNDLADFLAKRYGLSDEDEIDEALSYVVYTEFQELVGFTKSGTCLNFLFDDGVEASAWKWYDVNKLWYSLNFFNWEEPGLSGITNISFDNKGNMYMLEDYEIEIKGETLSQRFKWTFTPSNYNI